MKEAKKSIPVGKIVYEITEEELEKIKRHEREEGRIDIANYLIFSIKYYSYKLNLAGAIKLIDNIVDFVCNRTDCIENIYGHSFHEYVRKYR